MAKKPRMSHKKIVENIVQGFTKMKIDPKHLHLPDDSRYFVFGSNKLGIHGAGAAKYALTKLGATAGLGEGLSGRSYAIPTCSVPGMPLPLFWIKTYVERFLVVAEGNSNIRFFVSEIGCGLAGHRVKDIAPMFVSAPANCDLPPGWRV